MLERARQIRKDRGYTALLERAASHVTREIEGAVGSVSPLREWSLERSKRELSDRMEIERTIDDVLDTTGTYFEPRGKYRGYGPYRSLRALQHRAEITKLATAVAEHEPTTVMEIGSANGGTLYVWARALEGVETLISTDLDYQRRVPLFEHFAAESGCSLHCIEGDSHSDRTERDVREALEGGSIDFLYIDGDHSYAGVKADFETYKPLVAEDGLIGLHDVETDGTGVPAFWAELERKEAYDCRKIVGGNRHGPGVSGIVYKGERE